VFAIARAWELVGARDSSISASLIRLAGQIPSHLAGDAHRDAGSEAEPGPAGAPGPDPSPAPGASGQPSAGPPGPPPGHDERP
jgi:hypothetical protein